MKKFTKQDKKYFERLKLKLRKELNHCNDLIDEYEQKGNEEIADKIKKIAYGIATALYDFEL